MLVEVGKIKNKTIYISDKINLTEREKQCLFEICDYAYSILKNYSKDRFPTALRKSNLVKKFPECKKLIELIDEKMKVKMTRGLPKFFYSFWYGIKQCRYCGNNECIFQTYKLGYKDYCNNISCVRQVVADNCEKKYGVRNYNQVPEIKEKAKQTNLKKYGVEYSLQSKEVREKIKQTNLKKYGVEIPAKNKQIVEKMKATCRKKYGVDNYSQINYQNMDKLTKEYIETNFLEKNQVKLYEMCKFYNFSATIAYRILKKFNINFKKANQSFLEQELYNYLKNLDFEIGNRQIIAPYELDLYSPKYNLAIEFDGLMFHSYGKHQHPMFNNYQKLDRNYHLRKTELCEQKGIQLLHIFENEWLDKTKKQIWLSMINAKLGLIENKIYARKCEVKEIGNDLTREFLNKNHIQGYSRAKIKLGLFYKNELVAVMTFGKARYNKNYEWELLRYANKVNTIVVGGFSKLLKYFEKHYRPKSLISYANRRWSKGDIYEKNGFNLIKITNPNYYYFHPNKMKLYSRIKFQKHKLQYLLQNYDPNKSEIENMIDNGYRIIFDCGNKVYLKIYN